MNEADTYVFPSLTFASRFFTLFENESDVSKCELKMQKLVSWSLKDSPIDPLFVLSPSTLFCMNLGSESGIEVLELQRYVRRISCCREWTQSDVDICRWSLLRNILPFHTPLLLLHEVVYAQNQTKRIALLLNLQVCCDLERKYLLPAESSKDRITKWMYMQWKYIDLTLVIIQLLLHFLYNPLSFSLSTFIIWA